eukprot:m51a1_g1284 hypothetical protein (384) ;mRNA; f:145992-147428
MKAFLALLLLAAAVHAASVKYVGNVSASSWHKDLDFRAVNKLMYDNGHTHIALFYSVDAEAAHSKRIDVAGGSSAIFALGGVTDYYSKAAYPSGWYGFWNVSFDVNVRLNPFSIDNIDVSGTAGFMGTAFVDLIEYDSNGKEVKTTSLSSLSWSKSNTGGLRPGDLHFIELTGTKGDLKVTVLFAQASKAGVIEYANTVVAPKVLESVVEIDNYPYQSSSNRLGLKVLGASGAIDADVHALVAQGHTRTFVDLKTSARINGANTDAPVDVSAWAEVTATNSAIQIPGTNFEALIKKATGQAGFAAKIATVKFPAGAKNIIYDPSLGSGTRLFTLTTEALPSAASSSAKQPTTSSKKPTPTPYNAGAAVSVGIATTAVAMMMAL